MVFPGLVLVLGTLIIGSSDGLTCWVCSSKTNPNCSPNHFSYETISTIDTQECPETTSACMATLLTYGKLTITDRECGSPSRLQNGALDTRDEGCMMAKTKMAQVQTCFCRDNYCNAGRLLKWFPEPY